MTEDEMPPIPDFLKRARNTVQLNEEVRTIITGTPQRLSKAEKDAVEKEERDKEIMRIAKNRWREWRHGDTIDGATTLHRPRVTTYAKLVRREFEAKGY